ncbi:hypothetical protein P7C70_g7125, partial [Phenoliferia sp. Uapishka_3]
MLASVAFGGGLLLSLASALPTALPATSTPGPIVKLDYATFQGSNASGIVNFLGMPFAQPVRDFVFLGHHHRRPDFATNARVPFYFSQPLGNLRFALPLPPLDLGAAVIQATARGSECTQQSFTSGYASGVPSSVVDQIEALPGLSSTQSGAEDCLTINVQTPANVTKGTLLPVLVWIYGGGFEYGSSSYDATPLIARSEVLGTPVIVVSMNYRLNAFGWMASKEILAAGSGNAALYDQRLALRWIQKYIAQFNGDPTKVTVWGESAGSISIALQMVAFDGDLTKPKTKGSTTPLFRGAFMESGAQLPTGSILNGQEYYDSIALATGCTNTDSAKSLACLRAAPYDAVVAAMDQTPGVLSYQGLRNAWLPRTDGTFITHDAQLLVSQGKIATLPFIIGDCDDEGTLFSVASSNITTDAEALSYIQTNYLLGANDSEIATLALYYPQDPTQGSPFDTNYANQLSPQFKRLAAFIGDYAFQAPRRFFLNEVNKIGKVSTWSYDFKRGKAIPFLGSFHSSDLTEEFQTSQTGGLDNSGIDYLIHFTNTLNPNSASDDQILAWPTWTPSLPNLMTFLDRPLGGALGLSITLDNYRSAAMDYVTVLSRKYPM